MKTSLIFLFWGLNSTQGGFVIVAAIAIAIILSVVLPNEFSWKFNFRRRSDADDPSEFPDIEKDDFDFDDAFGERFDNLVDQEMAEHQKTADVSGYFENIPSPPEIEMPNDPTAHPREFVVAPWDAKRNVNKRNNKFRVRFDQLDSNFDCYIFTTSFPHLIAAGDHKINQLKAWVPQITDVMIIDEHSMNIWKAGAADWNRDDMIDEICHFLFTHLHEVYSWQFEKQKINITQCMNASVVKVELRTETRHHLRLSTMLLGIPGIRHDFNETYPNCMNHVGSYDFILKRAGSYTWDELAPEIIHVFEAYFPAGVEFTGEPEFQGKPRFSRKTATGS